MLLFSMDTSNPKIFAKLTIILTCKQQWMMHILYISSMSAITARCDFYLLAPPLRNQNKQLLWKLENGRTTQLMEKLGFFKLPHFFTHSIGKGKRAVISKQWIISVHWVLYCLSSQSWKFERKSLQPSSFYMLKPPWKKTAA